MEKKKQNENYSVPECEIVQVSESTYLMAGSPFNGQHNPAQPGGTSGDAKKAFDWMTKSRKKTRKKLQHGKTNREY